MKRDDTRIIHKSFDLLTSFHDVLGRRVGDLPANYEKGELLVDTAMDLETNVSKSFAGDNALLLKRGSLHNQAVVKIAQTFRTGTNDIDALDFVHMYLRNESQHQLNLHEFEDLYVLVNFRPVVTNKNWRMDCGVAGYDNRLGLPPFFPTRLRFEDYIFRLWIQKPGIVATHVDAVQTHVKNDYMRNPLAMDVFNEEICTLLKKKIQASVTGVGDLSIRFTYNGEVSLNDTKEILEKITSVHQANLIAPCEQALWEDGLSEWLPYELRLMELVFKDLSRFEVIHFHTDYIQFPFLRRQPWANITTMHGRLHAPDLKPLFDEYAICRLVSISHDQRRSVPNADWKATVYHGLPRSLHRLHEGAGRYLAFLGRISPEKRLDRAVAIARQAGMKLKVAAKVYAQERDYYERRLRSSGRFASSSHRLVLGAWQFSSHAQQRPCSLGLYS